MGTNLKKQLPFDPKRHFSTTGEWVSYDDLLGTTSSPLPFEEAREFVRSLRLRGQKGWKEFCFSGQRPENIPTNPNRTYKDQWKSLKDWLGSSEMREPSSLVSFTEARKIVRLLNFKNRKDWHEYAKSTKRDRRIPTKPKRVYKKEWVSWEDWTGCVSKRGNRKFKTFKEAKSWVQTLGLKNSYEWSNFCKTTKPNDIPTAPWSFYSKEWVSLGDWLGTNYIPHSQRKFWPFKKARSYMRKQGLKSWDEWRNFHKSKDKPEMIPSSPQTIYKNKGWIGFGDWLGTGNIQTQAVKYWCFNRSRKYVRKLKLDSRNQWVLYWRRIKNLKIPAKPNRTYAKSGWKGWKDFLGKI